MLGFNVDNPVGTYGLMALASLTFAAIILALNVWLGSVGQFIGLVLMVVQLVTAGGTFPGRPCRRRWRGCTSAADVLRRRRHAAADVRRELADGLGRRAACCSLWLVAALALAAIGVTRMTHFRTLRDLRPS